MGHMDKIVIQIYSGILLTHKKQNTFESILVAAEPRACYTEGSQSEGKTSTCILTIHTESRKMILMNPICREAVGEQM